MPSKEAVAKAPEKKGTTKTQRHKVFSEPAKATPGIQKRLPLCLGVFVVQRLCLLRHPRSRAIKNGWYLLNRTPLSLGFKRTTVNHQHVTAILPAQAETTAIGFRHLELSEHTTVNHIGQFPELLQTRFSLFNR